MTRTTPTALGAPSEPFPLEHGTVDGVRTVAAELPVDPTITLTFGVGYVDASPATAGLTHLVEHLVMRRVGHVSVTNNAESGVLTTSFYAVGAAADRVDFVRRVCEAVTWLRGITDADLDLERRTILSEIGPSGIYAARDPFATRYGARGLGTTAVTHARLLDWTAAEVREIAATWFHRDNAVLVSTTSLPDGLSLPLPAGPAVTRAPHPEPLLTGPAWSDGPGDGIALTGTCSTSLDDPRRSVAATVLRDVLHSSLRTLSGQVYSVDLTLLPAGPDAEVWALATDPTEESVCDVLVAALDVVDRLAQHGPTPQELDRTRATLLHQLDLSSFRAAWLDSWATYTLRGLPLASVEEAVQATRAVTVDDVRAAIAQFAGSLLVTMPAGHLPHEAAAARLDRLSFAEPHPDPEGPTDADPSSPRAAQRDRGARTSVTAGGGSTYSGKFFGPARGLRIGIRSDRFVLHMPGSVWVLPFADIVLVGSDADGDIEVVTERGGVAILAPRHFRGLAGPLASALDRLPRARSYVKDRVVSALPAAG